MKAVGDEDAGAIAHFLGLGNLGSYLGTATGPEAVAELRMMNHLYPEHTPRARFEPTLTV